ncbi:MAG: serine hydrolase domain-containing protein [Pseudomonadales bacterium]
MESKTIPINGICDSQFSRVQDAFAANFQERGEIGASVCVVLEGRKVVDLWAGHMDAARTIPWHEHTLVNVWSLGKAMSALALLKLMDGGACSPESRVSDTWPEFAAAGKRDITFAQAMSHSAGLCGIEAPLPADAFYHWDTMVSALEAQSPFWEPGQGHGYHTNTFGFLIGEPVRRITGTRLKDYFQREIAGPMGVDFHLGVSKIDVARCADLVMAPRPAQARPVTAPDIDQSDPMNKMRQCIYNNPALSQYDFNSTAWRMAEFPSTSPQSNARSVATLFGELSMILAGSRNAKGIISKDLLERAVQIESDGEDLNIMRPTRFGLGFQLTQPDRPLGPNPGTFGHYGNGGHLGFADPNIGLGFAYHMNHQGYAWRDPRNIALTEAVYQSI